METKAQFSRGKKLYLFKFVDENGTKLGDRVYAIEKSLPLDRLYLLVMGKIKELVSKRRLSKAMKKKFSNAHFGTQRILDMVIDKYYKETGLLAGFFELTCKIASLHPLEPESRQRLIEMDSRITLNAFVREGKRQFGRERRFPGVTWCIEVIVSSKYVKKLPGFTIKNFDHIK